MIYKSIELFIDPFLPYSEILIAELAEAGFDCFDDNSPPKLIGYCPGELFDETKIKAIINNLFQETSTKFSNPAVKEHPDENWNTIWEASFEPVKIKNKVIIRAPFHSIEEKFSEELIIQPRMSFGTGHHETTFQMVENMLELNFRGKDVLDVGTGTGVLAILAHKLGASQITCVDIDEWSIENARENFALNQISNFILLKGDPDVLQLKEYDVILANINKSVLKKHLPTYANFLKKNGNLLISGFFNTDCNELITLAAQYRLELTKQTEKNSWACLAFTKI